MHFFVYRENARRFDPQDLVAFPFVKHLCRKPAGHRLANPTDIEFKSLLLLRGRRNGVCPADDFALAWNMQPKGNELTRFKVRDWSAIRCNMENAKVLFDYLNI